MSRFILWLRLRGRRDRGCFRRCSLGRLRLSALAFQFDQRLSHFEVVALTYEESCDFSGGRRRNRDCGLVGFQLDQRLPFGHLITFVDEHLDDVAAFNAFREKWQFNFHGFYLFFAGRHPRLSMPGGLVIRADIEVLYRSPDGLCVDGAMLMQRVQHGNHQMFGIDFKESS